MKFFYFALLNYFIMLILNGKEFLTQHNIKFSFWIKLVVIKYLYCVRFQYFFIKNNTYLRQNSSKKNFVFSQKSLLYIKLKISPLQANGQGFMFTLNSHTFVLTSNTLYLFKDIRLLNKRLRSSSTD